MRKIMSVIVFLLSFVTHGVKKEVRKKDKSESKIFCCSVIVGTNGKILSEGRELIKGHIMYANKVGKKINKLPPQQIIIINGNPVRYRKELVFEITD